MTESQRDTQEHIAKVKGNLLGVRLNLEYRISEQLHAILINTAKELGWL